MFNLTVPATLIGRPACLNLFCSDSAAQRVPPLNDLLGFYPSKPSSITLEPVKLVIESG